MGCPLVIGLDVSANRIAFAICDTVNWRDAYISQKRGEAREWIDDVSQIVLATLEEYERPPVCIEINLHPRILYQQHPSPAMVLAYMRSRWIEGMLLRACGLGEPIIIKRKKGGLHDVPRSGAGCYALQATGGKDAKAMRRLRMSTIYGFDRAMLSEDEVDALAIAHDASVALGMDQRIREGRGT
jgi:hypothetical protein